MTWVEVGDGAFCGRYDPWDVNVGVVRGADGLCVIDSRGSHRQARELLEQLAALGGPVRAVVNTHWHFDHTWGNRVFADAGVDLWGHVSLPETMRSWFEDVRDSLRFGHPELDEELGEVVCTPPDHLVDPFATVELGDRAVEIRHLGPGHTDGDVVASCTGAGVLFAGDLVEEAGPPAYGDDSHPLAWPGTAARLLWLLDADTTVVPGHGAPVGRPFCERQAQQIGLVADLCRELHTEGVSRRDALAEGGGRWPFPPEHLREAVLLAWDALDPS